MRTSVFWLLLLGPLLLASCSSFQEFVPRERATGESPTGKLAAEYPIVWGEDAIGDVRVWCHGGWDETDDEGQSWLVLHLGFELENRSEVPLVVERTALRLTGLRTAEGPVEDLRDPRRDGSPIAEPGQVATVHFLFERPSAGVRARDLLEFQAAWAVVDVEGDIVSEVTPFRAFDPPRRQPVYYGAGWGWGWGATWGQPVFLWGLNFH